MDRSLQALLVFVVVWLAGCGRSSGAEAQARAIERRILSPCCWRQTLEDHDSEVAQRLRAEIERRVAAGDSAAVIEDDLARRYGEAIRAMPRGWDPRVTIGGIAALAAVLGALVVARFVRRRSAAAPLAGDYPAEDREYEERLDDELLEVD
jgi:cytochrome c-type biogenesis protein CcmH/NrfF